jgi:signal transduction protein with GAF and PtsI domain
MAGEVRFPRRHRPAVARISIRIRSWNIAAVSSFTIMLPLVGRVSERRNIQPHIQSEMRFINKQSEIGLWKGMVHAPKVNHHQ